MKTDNADLHHQRVLHNRGVGLGLTAVLLSLLSACGAGGSGTLTGNLMDGYIKGAKICIDLNSNGSCDASEPTATTGNKGSFTVTAPTGTDLSAVHLLAEVPVGAVDEDTPNTPLIKAYKMMAPASTPLVVSPLTTVVSTHIKDGKTLSQAQAQARTDMGLPADHDFSKDYVAKADTAAHNVAKMMAAVLAEKVGSAPPDLTKLKSALDIGKLYGARAYASNSVDSIISDIQNPQTVALEAASSLLTNFDESVALPVVGFDGGDDSSLQVGPAGTTGKSLKITRNGGAVWAGAFVTLSKPIGFGNNSKSISANVYSPSSTVIKLKIEGGDGVSPIEVSSNETVQANTWQKLTWDFPSVDTAKQYTKLVLLPNLGTVDTNKSYYFDDFTLRPSTTFAFASAYKAGSGAGYSIVSKEGGAANYYFDEEPGRVLDWWRGVAPDDSVSSFYFGVGANSNNKPWGIGAYVKAPNNGVAAISTYTKVTLNIWGNDQLFAGNVKPKYAVILKAPKNSADCIAELKAEVASSAGGAQSYTVNLSNFTIQNACGLNNVSEVLQAGVAEVHIQLLGDNLQYSLNPDSGFYPNGLNIGPILFK